jgi:branched-chain amino acid transport system permease protein
MKKHPIATTLTLVFLALVFLPAYASSNYLNFATQALIIALLAISLNLLVGYGGMVSFGHAAYFGTGAYGCALLMKQLHWPFLLAMPAATLVTVAIALFAGYFCVQLTKVYFSMLTLAFAEIIYALCFRWNDLTGGDQGLTGVPFPDFEFLRSFAALKDSSNEQLFFYVALAVVGLCTALTFIVIRSPFGRCLVAARENPQRCVFIGLNVHAIQLTTFCIAAALASVAGSLFGIYNRGVFPDLVHHTKGAEILIMVLLGGSGSFWGPAIGATVLIWLQRESTSFTEYWGAILGAILAVLTLTLPDGLAGIGAMLKRQIKGNKEGA